MMRYRDLKIGTKQVIGFGIILAFLTAVSVFAILNMASVSEQIIEISGNWMPRASAVADINISTSLLRSLQIQHAVSTDSEQKEKLAGQIIELIDRINENLDRYVRLKSLASVDDITTDKEIKLFDDFNEYWEEYQNISFSFFRLSGENRTHEALALMENQAQEAFTLFSRSLVELVKLNNQDAMEAANEAKNTYQLLRALTITILVSAVLISILIAVLLIRSITTPLQGLLNGVERISAGELDIKIPENSQDEIGHLTGAFNRMASALRSAKDKAEQDEKIRAEADQLKIKMAHAEAQILEAENNRKAMELNRARDLQLSMLPEVFPTIPGFEIAAKMVTASEVGGDYYDFINSNKKYSFVIGDATGHGLHAGTMVTATKSVFKALGDKTDPVIFIRQASQAIKSMGLKNMFMALAFIRIENHTIRLASAGMPFPLLYRNSEAAISEIPVKGMPLGSFPDYDYQEFKIDMTPGDILLFMSDGIVERMNNDLKELGIGPVRDSLVNSASEDPEQIIEKIIATGETWAKDRPLNDDLTFLLFRRKL